MTTETPAATAIASEEGPHIGDVEPHLRELRAEIEILHHLAQSSSEVDVDTWLHLENRLERSRKKIEQAWCAAFERHNADREKKEATPGPRKGKNAALARTVADECDVKRAVAATDSGPGPSGEVSEAFRPPSDHQDVELLRLYLAFLHAHADHQGTSVSTYFLSNSKKENDAHSDKIDAMLDQWWELADRIRDTPATTLPGLRAKADAMRMVLEGTVLVSVGDTIADLGEDHSSEDRFAWSLARDVIRVTANAASDIRAAEARDSAGGCRGE